MGPIVSCKLTSHSNFSEVDSCVPNDNMSGTCSIVIGKTKSFNSLKKLKLIIYKEESFCLILLINLYFYKINVLSFKKYISSVSVKNH